MERSLVERARAGDRAAFEALVRLRVDAVYRTAYSILGNAADAQDATQEALIAVWRGLPALREIERFDAWLGRIVTNACRMSLRHRRTVRELPIAVDDAEPSTGAQPVHDAALEADRFDRAFERLTVDQRALIVAHHLDGRPIDQLAIDLRVPIGTVKSRLHTARAALQRALADDR